MDPELAELEKMIGGCISQALHAAVELQKYHVDSWQATREAEVDRYAGITSALVGIYDQLPPQPTEF